MLIVLHIIIAFLGIIFSGFSLFLPSKRKLQFSYVAVAMTFLTGTLLIILKPAHLVTACFEGLLYLGVVGILIVAAQKKLAKAASPSTD